MLTAFYNPVGHQVVVGELDESALGILIAHTDKIQVTAVLSRVSQVKILLFGSDGSGHLASVLNDNIIWHKIVALQSVAQALCPRFTAFTHRKIMKKRKAIFDSPN
jgi:hypothetical protein